MASWLQVGDAIRSKVAQELRSYQTPLPPVKVYVGFPEPNTVQKDLRDRAVDTAHISIWHLGPTNPTSRYGYDEKIVRFDATEKVTIDNLDITISGTPTQGDNVFVHINGQHTFAAHVDLDDTLADIATKLAGLINASSLGVLATPASNVITLAANPTTVASIAAATFGYGSSTTEVTREQGRFALTIWAPNEAIREAVAGAVRSRMCAVQFLDYADLSKGRILYGGTIPNDMGMSAGIVTERIFFHIEYATYNTEFFGRVGTIVVTHATCDPVNMSNNKVIETFEVF